jgi:hypothetical protein
MYASIILLMLATEKRQIRMTTYTLRAALSYRPRHYGSFGPERHAFSGNEKRGGWTSGVRRPARQFQMLEGFGGAFTEAVAVTLQKLSAGNRERALRAYFDRQAGHGYSLCRTHINSCDFALDNYAYARGPGRRRAQPFHHRPGPARAAAADPAMPNGLRVRISSCLLRPGARQRG